MFILIFKSRNIIICRGTKSSDSEVQVMSDSSDLTPKKKKRRRKKYTDSDDSKGSDSDDGSKKKNKGRKRKRIKNLGSSSEESEEGEVIEYIIDTFLSMTGEDEWVRVKS